MASRVESFDESILFYAKKEFLEKGFTDASLRVIAGNAGVSTSTIYTRYVDKEGLFRHIVEPASNAMIEYVRKSLDSFNQLSTEDKVEHREEYSDEGFPGLLEIIYNYFDEFKLIVTCSPNTFYHDFLEQIVAIDMQCTKEFMTSIGCKAFVNNEISDGFLHVVSSAFYSGISEVVIHEMPKDEAKRYIDQLRKFYQSGWNDYF